MEKRRNYRYRDQSRDSDSSSRRSSQRHSRHNTSRRPEHSRHDYHRRHNARHSRSEKYRKRSRERSSEAKKHKKPEVKEKVTNANIEIGMRSWNEVCVKPIPEVRSENIEDEGFRVNEVWVGNDLNHLKIFNKKQDTEKWQHDKFGDILRDYDNLERIKELKEIKAQQKAKRFEGRKNWRKESPKWLHDMFEGVIRTNDPEYRYVVRRSPPCHQDEE